jgi:hypothetical protein
VVRAHGRSPYARWRTFDRGQTTAVEAPLHTTAQRFGAWTTLGLGVAGVVAGGFLTGFAFDAQSRADTLNDALHDRTKSSDLETVGAFQSAIDARDTLRAGAGIAFGIGGAALATGAFLFVLDDPSPELPPKPDHESPATAPPNTLALAPVVAPARFGAIVAGTF